MMLKPYEEIKEMTVRFKTIGDMTCMGAVESEAAFINDIIDEVSAARTIECGTHSDDKPSQIQQIIRLFLDNCLGIVNY